MLLSGMEKGTGYSRVLEQQTKAIEVARSGQVEREGGSMRLV
jgi:hypothetical protein